MSVLRVQKIANEAGTGAVEFTKGATFPVSQNFTAIDMTINTTGIATVTNLNTSGIVVGIMTGTLKGNGFNVTSLPGDLEGSKVIGLHLITQ
jgi:hypothetical protein